MPATNGCPGRTLCVDFYEKSWKSALLPKYWLRPFTKRMTKSVVFAARGAGAALLPRAARSARFRCIGRQLKRIVPVANYVGELPLDRPTTTRMVSVGHFRLAVAEFDNPQNAATVRGWLEDAGMESIEVLKAGHLVGRGVKPKRGTRRPT